MQDAEAAEAALAREDKDSELRPVHHKQKEHGAPSGGEGEDEDDDDDDDVSAPNHVLRACVRACVRARAPRHSPHASFFLKCGPGSACVLLRMPASCGDGQWL